MPTSPSARPRNRLVRPAHGRIAEGRRHGDEGDAHEREIILRPELRPPARRGYGARKARPIVAMVPATNEPIAEVASAGPPRPALAILLPSSAVAMEALSPGRVDQDRGGRAAIHAAVIDAREHDDRAARIELEGDRQQQCDRQRRADARQHPDGGAEQHADEREQQVHRLDGDR